MGGKKQRISFMGHHEERGERGAGLKRVGGWAFELRSHKAPAGFSASLFQNTFFFKYLFFSFETASYSILFIELIC